MGIIRSALLVAEGTNLDTLSKQDIRAGFLLNLPFRLRVGKLRRFSFMLDGPVEICIRNRVDIPKGTDSMHVVQGLLKPGGLKSAFSQALIVLTKPSMDDKHFNAIISCLSSNDPAPLFAKCIHRVHKSMNAFLLAYHMSTGELFGGSHLHKLTDCEFISNLLWDITIVCHGDNRISDTDLVECFDIKPDRDIRVREGYYGNLDDLPETSLSRIGDSISQCTDYIFYELAFEAKTRMCENDYISALLLAVVALEGVHAAYLGYYLTEMLPSEQANGLIENLLRGAGLFNLYKITPYLFMNEQERPSDDQLIACGQGITMRNEFMHSLRKKGRYAIKNRTPRDISNAYSSVLQVYNAYVIAFEKRLHHEADGAANREKL